MRVDTMAYAQQGQWGEEGPYLESKNQVYENTLRSSWILKANGKAILKRINTIECGRELQEAQTPPKHLLGLIPVGD